MNEENMHSQQLESRVTRLEEGQAQLLSATARIESLVENLASGQKGVYNRINRPWQWGVVVAVFMGIFSLATVFGTILTLSLDPIGDSINDMQKHADQVNFYFDGRMNVVEVASAIGERDRYWLEKMADRNNDQIDRIWIEMKHHHNERLEDR